MTDLPDGWEWATLGELRAAEERSITDGPFGSNLASRHYTTSGARVVRLQNIGDGEFIDDEAFIGLDHFARLRAHEVQEGDLAIASLGNELPRACMVPDLKCPAIVKADCIKFRPNSEIVEAKWVLYSLLSVQSKEYVADRIRGVGRPRLGLGEIRKIPIPLPPLAEQRRIVAVLEDHLSRVDEAGSTLRRAIIKDAALRQSLIDHLLAPYSDKECRLRDTLASKPVNGRSVSTRQGGFPVLRLNSLKGDKVDLGERKEGDWSEVDAANYLVAKGDFFVSRGNGSLDLVARGALVREHPDPVAFPDTMIRLHPNLRVLNPEYLSLAWSSSRVRGQIRAIARTTAGIYKVNQKSLGEVSFPVPDLDAQHSFVRRVGELINQLDFGRKAVDGAKNRSEQLRRSLLREAFAGRLVEQDPDDEPASVLLESIRAERANAPTSRRVRKQRAVKDQPVKGEPPEEIDPDRPCPDPVGLGTQGALELGL